MESFYGTNRPGMDQSGREKREVTELVKCILRHFNRVSARRVHNLAFISEAEFYDAFTERITDAVYYAYLSGCYSEAVSQSLEFLEGVSVETVRIKGEDIETLIVEKPFNCHLNSAKREIINSVCTRLGDKPPEMISNEIDSIIYYQETKMHEPVVFGHE